jgi:hypothetical protein
MRTNDSLHSSCTHIAVPGLECKPTAAVESYAGKIWEAFRPSIVGQLQNQKQQVQSVLNPSQFVSPVKCYCRIAGHSLVVLHWVGCSGRPWGSVMSA